MNKSIAISIVLAAAILTATANCGCLKCSKHLTVVSPPHQPCKIIYRDGPHRDVHSCPTPLPYKVQTPIPIPPLDCLPRSLNYKIALPVYTVNTCNGGSGSHSGGAVHNIQVQTPLPLPTALPCTFLTNLIAKADRVVIPRPPSVACPDVSNGGNSGNGGSNPGNGGCYSIWQQIPTRNQIIIAENPQYQPIIQKLPEDLYRCGCRYGTTNRNRRKRSYLLGTNRDHVGNPDDLIRSSLGLLLDLVPNFIKTPLQRTVRNWRNRQELENRLCQRHDYHDRQLHVDRYHQPHPVDKKYSVVMAKPWKPPPNKYLLLRKLKQLNDDDYQRRHLGYHHGHGRDKRSTVFDSSDLQMPFFQIRDYEDSDESVESNEISSEEEEVGDSGNRHGYRGKVGPNLSEEFLEPFDAKNLVPHNPIFYLLNAPIRFLHHFHNLGRQITPVFKSVPQVFVNSRRYFRDFGRHFKNDVLSAASDLIGDFDDFGRIRHRRSVPETDEFEPNFDEVEPKAQNGAEKRANNKQWLKKLTDVMKTINRRPKKRDVSPTVKNDSSDEHYNDGFFQFLTQFAQNGTSNPTEPSLEDESVFDSLLTELEENDSAANLTEPNPTANVKSDSFLTDPVRNDSVANLTRPLEPYEPEYTSVFGLNPENEGNIREKRFILKVVDEDEVQDFLREKLSRVYGDKPKTVKPKSVTNRNQQTRSTQKKMLVEKLSPKVILDNNGLPFMEINGVKRPLFPRRKSHKKIKNDEEEKLKETENVEKKSEEKEDDDIDGDMQTRIENLIEKARKKIGPVQTGSGVPTREVSTQVIRDKIRQILDEIQNLINTDFDRYSTINKNLAQLENFKDFAVQDWKKVLADSKTNDMGSKIRILDHFKELQLLKDGTVKNVAAVLDEGSDFMLKRLIKTLVRLQKLQCVIYRVVDDFGEKIKMGTLFDVRKELKYVEYLNDLHFSSLAVKDLHRERDLALENQLQLLEDLRRLLENSDADLQEEAGLLWEIKNVEKLQKDAIIEMNAKISRGQKVRKELKILFDLLRQQENCEERQRKLLHEIRPSNQKRHNSDENDSREGRGKNHRKNWNKSNRIVKMKNVDTFGGHSGNFKAHTIVEDKRPVKIVSNGYTLNAYKLNDF